jgi:tRNA(adenine34) deaminase
MAYPRVPTGIIDSSTDKGDRVYETYIRRGLALASTAADSGETAVGALVVRGDAVIGEGIESTLRLIDPSAHAEVLALRAACQHEGTLVLTGCELYTTVEPCVLCSYAIRRTGITRVVFGIAAGQAGGVTSKHSVLTDDELVGFPPPPAIVSGVLAQQCLAALQRRRTNESE